MIKLSLGLGILMFYRAHKTGKLLVPTPGALAAQYRRQESSDNSSTSSAKEEDLPDTHTPSASTTGDHDSAALDLHPSTGDHDSHDLIAGEPSSSSGRGAPDLGGLGGDDGVVDAEGWQTFHYDGGLQEYVTWINQGRSMLHEPMFFSK
jgi:hypothetical protein